MKRSLMILVLVGGLLAFAPVPTLAGGRYGGGHVAYGGHWSGGHGHWSGGSGRWYGGHPGRWYGGHPGWYWGGPRFYGGVVIGPGWWGWPYPYWYYSPNYVYATPPAVVQGPSVYIQQEGGTSTEPSDSNWYYCPSSKAYYPNVQTCREAWVKVPPRPQ
jgi:hypothetical protein